MVKLNSEHIRTKEFVNDDDLIFFLHDHLGYDTKEFRKGCARLDSMWNRTFLLDIITLLIDYYNGAKEQRDDLPDFTFYGYEKRLLELFPELKSICDKLEVRLEHEKR